MQTLESTKDRVPSSRAAERKRMKYPPKRDRLARYTATWTFTKKDTPVEALMLVLVHDCVTKKASLSSGQMKIRDEFIQSRNTLLREYCRRLHLLDLNILKASHDFPFLEYGIVELGRIVKFNSPPEVVCFINQVGAALDQPAVLALERHIIQREVLTDFMSRKRRWMDEDKWLAMSAVFEFTEVNIFKALLGLKENGDGVLLTLKPSPNNKPAALLTHCRSVGYDLSSEDQNKLAKACANGKIREEITVRLKYFEPVSAAREFAKALAPHVSKVEMAPSPK